MKRRGSLKRRIESRNADAFALEDMRKWNEEDRTDLDNAYYEKTFHLRK